MPPRRRQPVRKRDLVRDFFVFFGLVASGVLYRNSLADKVKDAISSSLASSAQSHLMPVRGNEKLGEGDISNGNIQDFDVVRSLTNIVDHPRRFLGARYVTTARVLSENVTGPMFGRPAWGRLDNDTAELEIWLWRDTADICNRALEGIRYNIASLARQQRRCNITDLATQRPLVEATSEEAASAFGDVRCSPENIEKRGKLLRSVEDLGKDLGPACDEAQKTILSNPGTLHRFRRALMSTAAGVESELKTLLDAFALLLRADGDMNGQAEEVAQHLLHSRNLSGARLDVLASRPANVGDLDPFTAIVLHLILGSSLVSSRMEPFHAPPQYVVDATKTGQVLPIRDVIRQELDWQAQTFNQTSELLSSSILPGVREWLNQVKDAKNSDFLETNEEDDDEIIKRYVKDEPHLGRITAWMRQRRFDSAERIIRGIEDGADHLELLTGYLAQLRSGVPGMLARLDDWDADVGHLTAELKAVISSGRRYTARKRRQPQDDGEGGEATLDITRWRVQPQDIEPIWQGLGNLLRVFEDANAQVEHFSPQDSSQDNWFETQMHIWSTERAALRAQWEESRKHKKPTKPAQKGFWAKIWGI